MEKLLSRKFLFSVLVTVMAFTLTLMGNLKAAEFLTFVGVVGATYIIGNVSSQLVDKQ